MLKRPQGILDLRRHLGELSRWKGSASSEALSVANAMERAMNFFMPYLRNEEAQKGFAWKFKVNGNWEHPKNSNDDDFDYMRLNVKYSQKNGWTTLVDEIEAALSLWLYSMKELNTPGNARYDFPSGNDRWIRGSPAQQQRCLHVLGPPEDVLLRDLEWWMPKGLDGILAARQGSSISTDKVFPYTVRRERVGHSGRRWPKQEGNEKPLTDDILRWDWKSATDLYRHDISFRQEGVDDMTQSEHKSLDIQDQPPQESFDWLVVESQDPLVKLYAKDLFSAFIWVVATHLEESSISRKLQANIQPSSDTGPKAWKSFSLENHELSRFVQSLTELNLWTEREAWYSIIPPLSATDNLPGLYAVITMAQKKAAGPEMDLAWGQAGSAYRWLFDVGMSSSLTSHIYVKSTAILWRFHQRLSSSESPHSGEDYHERGGGLKQELAKVQARLKRQEEQNQAIRVDLSLFFGIHKELERLMRDSKVLQINSIATMWIGKDPERRVYGTFQRPGDVFDRTQLHHAMRSEFIDREQLPSLETKSQWEKKYLAHIEEDYIEGMELVTTKLSSLNPYLLQLPEDICSAILDPFQTFECLLDSGADPNARDLDHWTPLHYACQRSRLGAEYGYYLERRDLMRVTTLIVNKVDVNAKGLDGNTPLHCAAMSGRDNLVILLIQSGGDVKVANFEGRTPLHLAVMTNDAITVSILIDNYSDINAKDQAGRTPLHLAAISGRLTCIQELIKKGADTAATDNSSATPLHLAAICDSQETSKTLCNTDALGPSLSKAIK